MEKPTQKPTNPCFSSGPCAKRPGWSLAALQHTTAGRSHRASPAKAVLKDVIEKQRALLGLPDDYRLGIIPASATGTVEAALWSMLGSPKDGGRGVDVFAWESFSKQWMKDITTQLKLDDVRTFEADYGEIPDLSQADPARDIVFAWNGTTSGACVPDADWIADDREGLTICDATSAVFGFDLPWDKLDVTVWPWQKALGSEAAHGMIALSPCAVERLETYTPPWPMPKIFQLTKKGKINEGIFVGETINTPAMIAVADCLDALGWIESIGGLKGAMERTRKSFGIIENWVGKTDWIDFLASDPAVRSPIAVTLKIVDPWFTGLADEAQAALVSDMCKVLDKEGAAYDLKAYRDAPTGFRIWCGATVEPDDVATVLPWIEWGYASAKADQQQKAA